MSALPGGDDDGEVLANVGLLGCGSAAALYLGGAARTRAIRYVACADLDAGRAASVAAAWGVPRACSPEDLLADPGVDIVVDLTPPREHGPANARVLRAGKHLYSEKPLATDERQAVRALGLARYLGLRVGCAPDTFLGPALQTARRLVDAGHVGVPFGASASVAAAAPETWHPRPAFYYEEGAGPLLDIGPYYLTALVSILGPIARVAGFATAAARERRSAVTGLVVEPQVPTHEVGVLRFANGVVCSLSVSFDAVASTAPPLEIHGSLGTLRLPDPEGTGGAVLSRPRGGGEWLEHAPAWPEGAGARCAGVVDLAAAVREGRPPRAGAELAIHVLEALQGLRRSATSGRVVHLRSTCRRPAPLEPPAAAPGA